jgi:hypothetical protein
LSAMIAQDNISELLKNSRHRENRPGRGLARRGTVRRG